MAVTAIYRTTIGKKVIMAVTGFVWVGYVVLHMFGNLKIFVGEASINSWAEFLRTFGSDILGYEGILWAVRAVLVVSLALHILMAYQLTRIDWDARQVKYSGRRYLSANLSSRSMRWGGIGLALFLVVHILHLTTGTLHPNYAHLEPYHNLVTSMVNPLVSGFYILAMIALGLHLYHGTWSLFQTLGVNAFERNNWLNRVGKAVAILIPVGFVAVPIAILLRLIR